MDKREKTLCFMRKMSRERFKAIDCRTRTKPAKILYNRQKSKRIEV
jgi:hypothetical protein